MIPSIAFLGGQRGPLIRTVFTGSQQPNNRTDHNEASVVLTPPPVRVRPESLLCRGPLWGVLIAVVLIYHTHYIFNWLSNLKQNGNWVQGEC